MKEAVLREFFLGKLDASLLANDVEGSVIVDDNLHSLQVEKMDKLHVVSVSNLVKLCDAVIFGNLSIELLEPIAFCIISSDLFEFPASKDDDRRVNKAIYLFDNPNLDYAPTISNLKLIRAFLLGSNESICHITS